MHALMPDACVAQRCACDVMGCCRAHIEHEFNKLRSSNSVSVRVKSVGDWWEADPESKLFCLAERALAREWNVQPLLVREGGTMPVSSICCGSRASLLCHAYQLQHCRNVPVHFWSSKSIRNSAPLLMQLHCARHL